MPYWATRCAVLASECLKATNQYSDAALQLIRLTSEDADLRSAVLLEQAALCFLRSAVKPSPAGGWHNYSELYVFLTISTIIRYR